VCPQPAESSVVAAADNHQIRFVSFSRTTYDLGRFARVHADGSPDSLFFDERTHGLSSLRFQMPPELALK
jgi:hypothetical protein